MLERVRDTWDDWWKVIAIFAVLVGAVLFVWDCNRSERQQFLDCLRDNLPPGADVLYEIYEDEQIPHYDRIDRHAAIDVAEQCYDDTQGLNSPAAGSRWTATELQPCANVGPMPRMQGRTVSPSRGTVVSTVSAEARCHAAATHHPGGAAPGRGSPRGCSSSR